MNLPNVPEMIPLPRAPAIFGLSRSAIYRLAAEGHVRLIKHGARTLVDAASVRNYLAQLPTLQLRQDAPRADARQRPLKMGVPKAAIPLSANSSR